MVPSENVSAYCPFFDLVQFRHQFGEEGSFFFVKQRPPSFLTGLGVNDMDAVRSLGRPVVL
jgi:hypothetical protein